MVRSFFIILLCQLSAIYSSKDVDIIIFSKDRPMQLDACCQSIQKWVLPQGLGNVYVLYFPTSSAFDQAFDAVKSEFPAFEFYKQTSKGEQFRALVRQCLRSTTNEYVMFAVDDDIVKDSLNLAECIDCLEKTGAYAFLLRLGKNIDYCFTRKIETPVPSCQQVNKSNIYIYTFKHGQGDWSYANNVDMTIYRKIDVLAAFNKIQMNDPWFESAWARMVDTNKKGLFFEESKILNLNINLVSARNIQQFPTAWRERMSAYSLDNLLELFNQGYRIDIDQFHRFQHNAPHICVDPQFIQIK